MRRSLGFGGSWWRTGLLSAVVVACVVAVGSGAASAQAASYGWSAVSVAYYHGCAITDGTVLCWGDNRDGQLDVPSGNDFTAVGAGGDHTCAVRSNGSIACWGSDGEGESSPPPGNDFTAVTAGADHTCALRTDGSIACWGYNESGQATPPPGNDFTAVSAGALFTCALRTNGSIACWGDNTYGEASPPSGTGFTTVSAGLYHACAVRRNGSIACWGDNGDGQASPPSGTGFTAVSAGGYHTCALRTDGSIACWGDNAFGQTSSPPGTFTAVSAGLQHTCALESDHHMVCWGAKSFGRCAVPQWAVASITPTSGPATGGTRITILGKGFLPDDRVVLAQGDPTGSGAIAADGVTVDSSTQITATTGGPAKPGRWAVWVIDPGGNVGPSPNKFTYTYPTPKVASVSPTSGPAAGGTRITIQGQGFLAGDKVVIGQGHGAETGAIAATAVSVDSPTQITATTGGPAKPGTWGVWVITPDGTTSRAPTSFSYTTS